MKGGNLRADPCTSGSYIEMSSDFLSVLKNVYEGSGVPTVITDDALRVVWKNNTSAAVFAENESLHGYFGSELPDTGLVNTVIKGSVYSFNILKAEDHREEKTYYVMELVRSEKMSEILNTPAIKNYLLFLCSRIRESAGLVTNSSDEIYDSVSCGIFDGKMITDRLNIIDKNIIAITREIIDPDQFFSLLDMDEKEVTLSMESELRRIAGEASSTVGRAARVTCDCGDDIFFRMGRSAFETVIAGMTARCCSYGGLPDVILFSAERTGDSRAEVSVLALHSGKTPEEFRKNISAQELRDPNKDMFFSYICDILCARVGAEFTRYEVPNGFICKMEFNVLPKDISGIAMVNADYSVGKGHFSDIALALAEFSIPVRYPFYDIDRDETDKEENDGIIPVFAEKNS